MAERVSLWVSFCPMVDQEERLSLLWLFMIETQKSQWMFSEKNNCYRFIHFSRFLFYRHSFHNSVILMCVWLFPALFCILLLSFPFLLTSFCYYLLVNLSVFHFTFLPLGYRCLFFFSPFLWIWSIVCSYLLQWNFYCYHLKRFLFPEKCI